jgi:hypothetical protein
LGTALGFHKALELNNWVILDGGQGMRRLEDLSRIHQPLGVDDLFDLFHQLVAVAVLKLHELALPDAHPVLTRAGTTHLDGLLDDGLRESGFRSAPQGLMLTVSQEVPI